ncbi:translation initiation factor IF-2-like [Serinus canaria]|uniref:translation initiation factor IF-2-like n=1 Tax=Serinus canaria TaxID=9135 RepID=UPI0021CC9DD8|nr:translation initiation factor IF-2-like [Serinus canaria]
MLVGGCSAGPSLPCPVSNKCRSREGTPGRGAPLMPGPGPPCLGVLLSPGPPVSPRSPQPLPPPRADSPPPQPGCRRVPGRSPGSAAAASSRICRRGKPRGGGPRASPPLAGLFFPVLAPAGEVGRAKGGGTPFPPPPLLRSTWEAKVFLLLLLFLHLLLLLLPPLGALRPLPSPRSPPGPPPEDARAPLGHGCPDGQRGVEPGRSPPGPAGSGAEPEAASSGGIRQESGGWAGITRWFSSAGRAAPLLHRHGHGMCSRRQKGLLPTALCLLTLACLASGVLLYSHLQQKVRSAEALAQKYKQQQEALSAQLQVVYEHRSRLERSLQKERGEHKKTKEDFLVYKLEAQEALNKEKQDSMNRYGALSSQHKILKVREARLRGLRGGESQDCCTWGG